MGSSQLSRGTAFNPCSAPTAGLWRLFYRAYVGCTTNNRLQCSSIYTDQSTSNTSRTPKVLYAVTRLCIDILSSAAVIPYFPHSILV